MLAAISKNWKWIAAGAAGVLVLGGVVWYFSAHTPGSPQLGRPDEIGRLITRVDVSKDTVIPGVEGAGLPANVAKPTAVSPGSQTGDNSYRDFGGMRMENDRFYPDTIILRYGDIANFTVTAVDRDYDFVQPDMGLNSAIIKGQTKTFQFSPLMPGKFIVFCPRCGGPERGPVGYIVVVPK